MLDSKILKLKEHFGVSLPEDWCDIAPAWILGVDGIGPVTLEHLRIYLAARDLTLKDDRTPEYWRENLSAAKIGHQLGMDDEPGADTGLMCGFTIFIDSAEQQAWSFQGLRADAEQKYRPLIVPIEWRALGRHPNGQGDYSLEGYVGRLSIERKSKSDAHGTILGWDDRRDRFKQELENLSRMDAAAVVVECSLHELLRDAPSHKRTAEQNRKALHRSIVGMVQDYKVPWLFCDTRRLAEQTAFRFLERFWRKDQEQRKAIEKTIVKQRKADAGNPAGVPVDILAEL